MLFELPPYMILRVWWLFLSLNHLKNKYTAILQ